jgi:nucleoid-associated protein YgaU
MSRYFWIVQRGDTLSAIAEWHLGAARRYPEIMKMNRKADDRIWPGDRLELPQPCNRHQH